MWGQSSKLEGRHIDMECRKILVNLRSKGTSLGKGFQWDRWQRQKSSDGLYTGEIIWVREFVERASI